MDETMDETMDKKDEELPYHRLKAHLEAVIELSQDRLFEDH
jgi:hypothetical protein